ncbi:hypothetical protein BAE44_0023428, partial [Dichanthelium oligosanthes]
LPRRGPGRTRPPRCSTSSWPGATQRWPRWSRSAAPRRPCGSWRRTPRPARAGRPRRRRRGPNDGPPERAAESPNQPPTRGTNRGGGGRWTYRRGGAVAGGGTGGACAGRTGRSKATSGWAGGKGNGTGGTDPGWAAEAAGASSSNQLASGAVEAAGASSLDQLASGAAEAALSRQS